MAAQQNGTPARVKVKFLFLLSDKQQVVMLLSSTEWDFSYGNAFLSSGELQVHGRLTGFGDVGGEPTVLFVPDSPWEEVAAKLESMRESGNDIFLEHVS